MDRSVKALLPMHVYPQSIGHYFSLNCTTAFSSEILLLQYSCDVAENTE